MAEEKLKIRRWDDMWSPQLQDMQWPWLWQPQYVPWIEVEWEASSWWWARVLDFSVSSWTWIKTFEGFGFSPSYITVKAFPTATTSPWSISDWWTDGTFNRCIRLQNGATSYRTSAVLNVANASFSQESEATFSAWTDDWVQLDFNTATMSVRILITAYK